LPAVVIAGTVYLMVRRVEVRLVLFGAGFLMSALALKPLAVFDTLREPWVAPICAAMGFASIMSATGCDKHLVHLLLAPLCRVRWLVIPGGILAAHVVNMAVPSQTSTAAALGPILMPLLLAGGNSPEVAGAALILGASFGGDLLNPGAQDVQAMAGVAGLSAPALSARVIPASIAGAAVTAIAFALINGLRCRKAPRDRGPLIRAAERGWARIAAPLLSLLVGCSSGAPDERLGRTMSASLLIEAGI
jgi:C4-dicarboxylate transporter, DcuC family